MNKKSQVGVGPVDIGCYIVFAAAFIFFLILFWASVKSVSGELTQDAGLQADECLNHILNSQALVYGNPLKVIDALSLYGQGKYIPPEEVYLPEFKCDNNEYAFYYYVDFKGNRVFEGKKPEGKLTEKTSSQIFNVKSEPLTVYVEAYIVAAKPASSPPPKV